MEAPVYVLFGNADNEPKVALYKPLLGFLGVLLVEVNLFGYSVEVPLWHFKALYQLIVSFPRIKVLLDHLFDFPRCVSGCVYLFPDFLVAEPVADFVYGNAQKRELPAEFLQALFALFEEFVLLVNVFC